jgi:hypothetical protein
VQIYEIISAPQIMFNEQVLVAYPSLILRSTFAQFNMWFATKS